MLEAAAATNKNIVAHHLSRPDVLQVAAGPNEHIFARQFLRLNKAVGSQRVVQNCGSALTPTTVLLTFERVVTSQHNVDNNAVDAYKVFYRSRKMSQRPRHLQKRYSKPQRSSRCTR